MILIEKKINKKHFKSFGKIDKFVYNKPMKKFSNILFSILFVIPTLLGVYFLTPEYVPTLNGGGGANSLNGPDKVSEDSIEQAWTTPTFNSYDDYFTDLNITKDTITDEDYTGKGTKSEPYVVRSTKGFLYLMNQSISGISLSYKYLELGCDVVLNDEMFDEDGNPYGGDGIVYSWQPKTGANAININGNGYSISNFYINDAEADYVSLFNSLLTQVINLNLKDFFVLGRERVSALCSSQYQNTEFNNVNILSGVVKGKGRIYALSNNVKKIANCKSYAKVYQLEDGAIQEGVTGLIAGGEGTTIHNCVFYGEIVVYDVSYVGGLAANIRHAEIVNCKNYGTIEKKTNTRATGVGGIVGYVTSTKVLNCENYGDIKSLYSNNAGICGYSYLESSCFVNCKNFGKIQLGAGIVGYGVSSDLISCANYGTMEGSGSGLFRQLESKTTSIDNVTTIRDCIIDCDFICNAGSGGVIANTCLSDLEIIDCTITADVCGVLPDHYSLIREYNSKYLWRYEGLDVDLNFEVLNNPTFQVVFAVWKDAKIEISNCAIDIHGVNIYLAGDVGGFIEINTIELNIHSTTKCVRVNNGTADRITLKNIIINEVVENKLSNIKILTDAKKRVAYDGIVRNLNAGGEKYFEYYGDDFSQFCIDYKTGKIGLKALSGKGLYQGNVIEETLKNKGFTKKTLQ